MQEGEGTYGDGLQMLKRPKSGVFLCSATVCVCGGCEREVEPVSRRGGGGGIVITAAVEVLR